GYIDFGRRRPAVALLQGHFTNTIRLPTYRCTKATAGRRTPSERRSKMNKVTVGVLATLSMILILSGLLAYVSHSPAPVAPATESTKSAQDTQHQSPLLWELFGPDASGLLPSSYSSWEATAARILLRFSLAAFLAGLLAFRPRRGLSFSRRNPFVA